MKFFEKLLSALGVFFAHTGAVAVGLGEDFVLGDGAAAAVVAVEQAGGAVEGLGEGVRQFEGVVQAAVEAHAAGGAVEVGGVTGEGDAADVVAVDDAHVDAVGAGFVDGVLGLVGDDFLQAGFDGGWGHLGFEGRVLAGVEGDAPAVGDAQQGEISGTFAPAIGDVGEALRGVVRRGRGWSPGWWFRGRWRLRRAARGWRGRCCGRPSHPARNFALSWRVSPACSMSMVTPSSSWVKDWRRVAGSRVARPARAGAQGVGQFPLFALQAVGVVGFVGEDAEVEHRAVAGGVEADLPVWARQAAGEEFVGDADAVQHVHGGGVEGGGAEVAGGFGVGFDDGDGDVLFGEEEGEAEADWAAADDDDVCLLHVAGPFDTRPVLVGRWGQCVRRVG